MGRVLYSDVSRDMYMTRDHIVTCTPQVAIAYHNMRRVEEAVTYFKQLGEVDPYRLDNLDTYRCAIIKSIKY